MIPGNIGQPGMLPADTQGQGIALPPLRRELILGGQRSGKSRRAELVAQAWLGLSTPHADKPAQHQAIFIATATAADEDMRARIRQHQADRRERLPGMQTLEEPRALAALIHQHSQPHCLLLIDCLTLWLANHYPLDAGFIHSPAATDLLAAIDTARGPLVFVSNEIGLGVVPMGREVRAYVDALGWINQQVAARCERVCLMAAGLPLMLKDDMPDKRTDNRAGKRLERKTTHDTPRP